MGSFISRYPKAGTGTGWPFMFSTVGQGSVLWRVNLLTLWMLLILSGQRMVERRFSPHLPGLMLLMNQLVARSSLFRWDGFHLFQIRFLSSSKISFF